MNTHILTDDEHPPAGALHMMNPGGSCCCMLVNPHTYATWIIRATPIICLPKQCLMSLNQPMHGAT